MSKTILIVESDATLSHTMKAGFEGKGFTVTETSDGKGSLELIRRQRPDLVVLEVELSAGQNGYILCGKLKKDDELKAIPVVIVGNADGFNQHRKLKTRADDYVAKPLDLDALVQAAGGLIGFPEVAADEVDESISLSDLVEDGDPQTGEFAAEEISVETDDSSTVNGDPELDMLDAAFDDATGAEPAGSSGDDEAFSALDALGEGESAPAVSEPEEAEIALDHLAEEDDVSGDRTMVGYAPEVAAEPPPAPIARPAPAPARGAASAGTDASDLRLRARLTELERAARLAEERTQEAENRIRELEDEVLSRTAEAEAAKAAGAGRNDREVFALRDAANRKDKDILRLKGEANEKDNEIVELRDKVLQLEQQLSETAGDMARKDAQVKTLTQKADQLTHDRKRVDQQLLLAKEEARSASANLHTVQSTVDDLRAQLASAQAEAEELRSEVEPLREGAEAARREADEARAGLEQAQAELEAAKSQAESQATAFAEEAGTLRRRLSELEASAHKHEDRISKFYAKIKDDEKVREKTRKALAIALQLLDEQQQVRVEIDVDEGAEA